LGGNATKPNTDVPAGYDLIELKKARSEGLLRQHFVDIHCHCLAGVDDGPATMAESLDLCRGLVEDSIASVIATPHQLGRFSGCNGAAEIREAVLSLNETLKRHSVPLTVVPGGDIRVDERICELLAADKILTLADGGRYVLLELPHEVFIDIQPLLKGLSYHGIEAVISHPERHSVLAKQPSILLRWLQVSAHLQITAASLLGGFGLVAQRAAWHFLSSGWVSLVATDSHDMNGRRPCMRAAFERISARLGEGMAQMVCIENPARIMQGRNIRPVQSLITGKCIDEAVLRRS